MQQSREWYRTNRDRPDVRHLRNWRSAGVRHTGVSTATMGQAGSRRTGRARRGVAQLPGPLRKKTQALPRSLTHKREISEAMPAPANTCIKVTNSRPVLVVRAAQHHPKRDGMEGSAEDTVGCGHDPRYINFIPLADRLNRGGLRKPQLDGDLRRIRSGEDRDYLCQIAMVAYNK